MPDVSVIVPAYNAESSIQRAIDSALEQHFAALEIVVVDDGSTDSTATLLKAYSGSVKTLNQQRSGPSAARNAGVAASSGRFLAFLDADDEWLGHKLERCVAILEQDPNCVLVYSDAIPVGEFGNRIAGGYVTPRFAHAPSMDELLRQWWPILPSAVVMRRETFDACGGFCGRSTGYEDPYLWLLAREQGEFHYIAQPLVLYRLAPLTKRMQKYAAGYEVFSQLVRERYGRAGRPLLKSTAHAFVSALGFQGLMAMREADMRQARRCFMCAMRYEPLNLRTASRLLRTFLPANLARALTGRTRSDRL